MKSQPDLVIIDADTYATILQPHTYITLTGTTTMRDAQRETEREGKTLSGRE